MSPLLEQFLSEARDCLQGIGEKLMQLESFPDDDEVMGELFRLVHTLKGNSGLFDFPEMTRVLHAGEDLLDAVRDGRIAYSGLMTDRLLDAMDFVGMLCDEIGSSGACGARHAASAVALAERLRELRLGGVVGTPATVAAGAGIAAAAVPVAVAVVELVRTPSAQELLAVPESVRSAAYRRARAGETLFWIDYEPADDCFFQGDDPFFRAQQTPGLLWGGIVAREPWPPLAELDAYRCVLRFRLLAATGSDALDEHFRYVPDQVEVRPLAPLQLVLPAGDTNGGAVYGDFVGDALALLAAGDRSGLERAARVMLDLANPELWLSSALRWLLLLIETPADHGAGGDAALRALIESISDFSLPDWRLPSVAAPVAAVAEVAATVAVPGLAVAAAGATATAGPNAVAEIIAWQREVLSLPDDVGWLPGRLRAAAAALGSCCRVLRDEAVVGELDAALAAALVAGSAAPLAGWLEQWPPALVGGTPAAAPPVPVSVPVSLPVAAAAEAAGETRFGRRADDLAAGSRSVKVDQAKIDRLMNLIGEMVVAKNALPYLAARAESGAGGREMAREIKAQHAVINRIAEEMQDSIMQVRMLPVSFVFQRFPRLVRDISRKLGKEVTLVFEGEETEADKNIIEALADPLVHIVRNSLDHGLEGPSERIQAGKASAGRITLGARQEGDRVLIEIADDGRGIDPAVIRRKALEKGIIDSAAAQRLSDQEAVNLVFAAGFSTAESVSDLSGRGVGMDVVRRALEKVNGSVSLESKVGVGTRLRLSLPLSMSVNKVMIVDADGQSFGVAMDGVVETVRLPQSAVRTIKRSLATVLRGRIVPLKPLNSLLGLAAAPVTNADDELAVLVVRRGNENVGIIVDDFQETADVILKPLDGVLGELPAYSGSALLGDGSVLLVLNLKELI